MHNNDEGNLAIRFIWGICDDMDDTNVPASDI